MPKHLDVTFQALPVPWRCCAALCPWTPCCSQLFLPETPLTLQPLCQLSHAHLSSIVFRCSCNALHARTTASFSWFSFVKYCGGVCCLPGLLPFDFITSHLDLGEVLLVKVKGLWSASLWRDPSSDLCGWAVVGFRGMTGLVFIGKELSLSLMHGL